MSVYWRAAGGEKGKKTQYVALENINMLIIPEKRNKTKQSFQVIARCATQKVAFAPLSFIYDLKNRSQVFGANVSFSLAPKPKVKL